MSFFARNAFEVAIEDMILDTPAPGKHSARSALRHLQKASALATLDPDMAAFRAITAEEEAATAVIHSLRRRQYEGSERLKPRNHVHKNSLSQLLEAIQGIFGEADKELSLRPQLRVLEQETPRKLQLELDAAGLGLGDRLLAPIPPLNFSVSTGDDPENLTVHDFAHELEAFASAKGTTSLLAHLKRRANLRNEILYASTQGVPHIQLNNFLENQRLVVKVLLTTYLLVDPYSEKQLFVQQCLSVLLRALERLPQSDDLGADADDALPDESGR